eukprot:Tbor_TRINITY_DN5473_c2_g1::TRINITY_DN5473_c2_g1_i2::g.25413::m.25413
MAVRQTKLLLRRGKGPVKVSSIPDPFRHVPLSHKPFQGGQNMFQGFLLRTENDDIMLRERARAAAAFQKQNSGSNNNGEDDSTDMGSDNIHINSPIGDFAKNRLATEEVIQKEITELIEQDRFTDQRGYNDTEWYQAELRDKVAAKKLESHGDMESLQKMREGGLEVDGTLLPERIVNNSYFKNKFGYNLVKSTEMPTSVSPDFSQLDLWAELPRYSQNMYFLYVVSRRRNTYAVCYDYNGKRLLPTYSVGNRGLKGGDKGFKAEGSAEVAHQVMSMYLNDLIGKVREHSAKAGRLIGKEDKIDIVLRVIGFYNGRAGAVRAVNDRSDFFRVRYFEDITPMPTDAPIKMAKAPFR